MEGGGGELICGLVEGGAEIFSGVREISKFFG